MENLQSIGKRACEESKDDAVGENVMNRISEMECDFVLIPIAGYTERLEEDRG
jgi:hypothetical protein